MFRSASSASKILGKRKQNSQIQYLIKWKNQQPTWQWIYSIRNLGILISKFNKQHKDAALPYVIEQEIQHSTFKSTEQYNPPCLKAKQNKILKILGKDKGSGYSMYLVQWEGKSIFQASWISFENARLIQKKIVKFNQAIKDKELPYMCNEYIKSCQQQSIDYIQIFNDQKKKLLELKLKQKLDRQSNFSMLKTQFLKNQIKYQQKLEQAQAQEKNQHFQRGNYKGTQQLERKTNQIIKSEIFSKTFSPKDEKYHQNKYQKNQSRLKLITKQSNCIIHLNADLITNEKPLRNQFQITFANQQQFKNQNKLLWEQNNSEIYYSSQSEEQNHQKNSEGIINSKETDELSLKEQLIKQQPSDNETEYKQVNENRVNLIILDQKDSEIQQFEAKRQNDKVMEEIEITNEKNKQRCHQLFMQQDAKEIMSKRGQKKQIHSSEIYYSRQKSKDQNHENNSEGIFKSKETDESFQKKKLIKQQPSDGKTEYEYNERSIGLINLDQKDREILQYKTERLQPDAERQNDKVMEEIQVADGKKRQRCDQLFIEQGVKEIMSKGGRKKVKTITSIDYIFTQDAERNLHLFKVRFSNNQDEYLSSSQLSERHKEQYIKFLEKKIIWKNN